MDYSRDEAVVVEVGLTDEGTDSAHAHNKQVPKVSLDISDKDAPNTKTYAILTYVEARELGNALIALAKAADEQNYKIERNI